MRRRRISWRERLASIKYRVRRMRWRLKASAPYWRHTFSRFKFRGRYVTWCFGHRARWIRVGQWHLNFIFKERT
jgi:hypothetical protein